MARGPYIIFFLLLFFTIVVPADPVSAAYQLKYKIEVHSDGSAKWVSQHVFVKGKDEALLEQLISPTYFSGTFAESVKSLVNAAVERTGRTNMTVENFAMTANLSGSYNVVRYQFDWREFAETEGMKIKIGDVFEVEGLFLFGDGAVNIIYPSEYRIESISPRPNEESERTLTWYGTADFKSGEPRIVLVEKTAPGFMDIVGYNILMIVSLTMLVGAGSLIIYYLRLRRKAVVAAKAPVSPRGLVIEDDEEKVINLLRAAGGSLYQSTITEQCGFSRSKTSKLLTTMENEGKVRREEKGREKVVTLINGVKESDKERDERRASR